MPTRPSNLPAEASWSKKESAWVVAERDPEGRLHGVVRYYGATGVLERELTHDRDELHGPLKYYFATGRVAREANYDHAFIKGDDVYHRPGEGESSDEFPGGIAPSIVRMLKRWRDGTVFCTRYFDAAGTEVFADGRVYPERPKAISVESVFVDGQWRHGAVNKDGARVGRWRYFDRDGVLVYEVHHKNGVAATRVRRASRADDPRVVYESGPVREGEWDGDITLLDAERKPLGKEDPTGAAAITEGPRAILLRAIESAGFAKLNGSQGNAAPVTRIMKILAASPSRADREAALRRLYHHTYNDGSIYDSTGYAAPMVAAIAQLDSDVDFARKLLSYVNQAAVFPRPSYLELDPDESSVALFVAKGLPKGVSHLVAMLASPLAVEAIACLAGCFACKPAVDALVKTLKHRDPLMRAATLAALGNLGELTIQRAQDAVADEQLLVRLAAVYGFALGGRTTLPFAVDRILQESLANADALREGFARLAVVYDTFEAELGTLTEVFQVKVANV